MEKGSHGKLFCSDGSFAHLGPDSAFGCARCPFVHRVDLLNARWASRI
jgi:hypothetical protein